MAQAAPARAAQLLVEAAADPAGQAPDAGPGNIAAPTAAERRRGMAVRDQLRDRLG